MAEPAHVGLDFAVVNRDRMQPMTKKRLESRQLLLAGSNGTQAGHRDQALGQAQCLAGRGATLAVAEDGQYQVVRPGSEQQMAKPRREGMLADQFSDPRAHFRSGLAETLAALECGEVTLHRGLGALPLACMETLKRPDRALEHLEIILELAPHGLHSGFDLGEEAAIAIGLEAPSHRRIGEEIEQAPRGAAAVGEAVRLDEHRFDAGNLETGQDQSDPLRDRLVAKDEVEEHPDQVDAALVARAQAWASTAAQIGEPVQEQGLEAFSGAGFRSFPRSRDVLEQAEHTEEVGRRGIDSLPGIGSVPSTEPALEPVPKLAGLLSRCGPNGHGPGRSRNQTEFVGEDEKQMAIELGQVREHARAEAIEKDEQGVAVEILKDLRGLAEGGDDFRGVERPELSIRGRIEDLGKAVLDSGPFFGGDLARLPGERCDRQGDGEVIIGHQLEPGARARGRRSG